MKRQFLTLCAAAALAVSGTAMSNEIYKWTDAAGNVHYGDRPNADGRSERINIASRRTNPAAVQARVQAQRDARSARDEAEAEEPKKKTPEERRAEAAERATKCQEHRSRLESYIQSQRLYREDENGERVYLNEQEVQEARNRVQEKVQEFCD